MSRWIRSYLYDAALQDFCKDNHYTMYLDITSYKTFNSIKYHLLFSVSHKICDTMPTTKAKRWVSFKNSVGERKPIEWQEKISGWFHYWIQKLWKNYSWRNISLRHSGFGLSTWWCYLTFHWNFILHFFFWLSGLHPKENNVTRLTITLALATF